MLSTCLSLPSVFVRKQDQSHQLAPYPLKFRLWREAVNSYLRVCCTTISTSFGNRAFGWCLVSAPCAEIKPIYCASIRQRERNCFRQLVFRMIDIKVLTKQRTACLHTISARCQIQSTPMIATAKIVQGERKTKNLFEFFRGAAYLQAAKRIKDSARRTEMQIYLLFPEPQPIFKLRSRLEVDNISLPTKYLIGKVTFCSAVG